eukprot:11785203-Alexandrium_andersonii.AAC.1
MVCLPHTVPLKVGADVITERPARGVSAVPNSEHSLTQLPQLKSLGTKLPPWSGTRGGGKMSYGAALPQLVCQILAYVLGISSPASLSSPPSAGTGVAAAGAVAGA